MPGPFYFAWVNSGTVFNPVIHNVEDEEIVSFKVDHSEGDFAGLEIDIRNPRIGLLSPNRKVWAWLSWFNGVDIVPLFFGRLVGVPNNIQAEIVRLQFIARPANFVTQKAIVAETLKGAPFYDPVWIATTALDDPDTALEAHAQLWHIDRVSHFVGVSGVLTGESGNEDFTTNDVPYDSVQIRLNQPPLRSVTVDGVVNWTQAGSGNVIVMSGNHHVAQNDSLIQEWPKLGANIGGGWTVSFSNAVDLHNIRGYDPQAWENIGYPFPNPNDYPWPNTWIFEKTYDIVMVGLAAKGGNLYPVYDIVLSLNLSYNVRRERSERVRFTLKTNVQSIITLPEESETLNISISSVDVGEPLPNAEIPIVDVRRNSYFPTTRGRRSLEYLVALARANLLLRSRAVEVQFACRFERAINLSCRKTARLFDHRLPGGQALGKIIAYSFGADGDGGALISSVTIGCAVGYGGIVAPAGGTPTYCEAAYVGSDYQVYAGASVVFPLSDVSYQLPTETPNDDGWNMLNVGSPLTLTSYNNFVRVMHIRPIEGGPFETVYNIVVSDLEVPQGINLEYAANDGALNVKDGADIAAITGTA